MKPSETAEIVFASSKTEHRFAPLKITLPSNITIKIFPLKTSLKIGSTAHPDIIAFLQNPGSICIRDSVRNLSSGTPVQPLAWIFSFAVPCSAFRLLSAAFPEGMAIWTRHSTDFFFFCPNPAAYSSGSSAREWRSF